MKETSMEELFPVLDRFILRSRPRVYSRSKMFPITSSNKVWMLLLVIAGFFQLVFLVLNLSILCSFVANLGPFKMLGFLANREGCLGL